MNAPVFLHGFARPAAGPEAFMSIVRGDGATVWDDLGNAYIDALGSLWYCNAGHGRRPIIDAMIDQLHTLEAFHTFDRFTNAPAEALCERLAALAPMDDVRVFLGSGGSESVDTSIKLARLAHAAAGDPHRTLVISRTPSYHGATYGAMTATGLQLNQAGFGPLVPDMVTVPKDDLAAVDAVLAERGGELAAIIAEPVIGAGGVHPPAPGYLAGLRERCDRFGGFLISDEVICGFGRLGSWFGAVRYGVRPDMVTFAKGVTSGYFPLGGVLIGPAVHTRLEGDPTMLLRHGYTYSGHPTGCAAALANLRLLEDERLLGRAPAIGARLEAGLEAQVDGERVTECRGDGAVWGLEFGPAVSAIDVREELLIRGVIARPIGLGVLAFCPPLVISDDEVDRVIDATAASIGAAAR